MRRTKPFYKLYAIATALAISNILWYLLLNRIYLWFGHSPKFAAGFSFITWLLTIPFTFWSIYFWAQNKLFPDKDSREAE
jgi:riboflavin transporter FmnP